jgi:putative intracellular protease/amidase
MTLENAPAPGQSVRKSPAWKIARWLICVGAFITVASRARAQEAKWESVLGAIDPAKAAVAGQWAIQDGALRVAAAQGGRLELPISASGEYDLRIRFARETGQHSIGLVVVQGGKQVAFEVDAWGMNLAGFQNIAGQTIQNNATRKNNIRLQNGQEYVMTVEVREDGLRGLLDGQEIASVKTDGTNLSLPDLWKLRSGQTCGLLAWDCDAVFHTIEVRAIGSSNSLVTRTPASADGTTNKSSAATTNRDQKMTEQMTEKRPQNAAENAADKTTKKPADSNTAGRTAATTGKRVLIVIASHHFFYREYADPRAELERAGIRVTVAAGRKARSQPHSGSGEGRDGGIVMPDIALSDVKVADYDAVLFSGGWGASMYQFAFEGRYNESVYNGNRDIKREANRIVNEFLAANKYVCALCNATSVLAWARVNGRSPLEGKQVCAPTRQAPPGVYNGQPGQPSCRWHAEVNGARMSPAGAIGQPGTAIDDVIVDGLIITGEDDISAREMGRKIVEVLSTKSL